eukprot:g9890.t1
MNSMRITAQFLARDWKREIGEIERVVTRNYTTSFLLCPLIWTGFSRTGFSRDVLYEDDIQWWSLDEMTQLVDEWERVYV